MAGAEILHEPLGAFQSCGIGIGAEGRNARIAQPVDQAQHQRTFGPHHDKIDALLARDTPPGG